MHVFLFHLVRKVEDEIKTTALAKVTWKNLLCGTVINYINELHRRYNKPYGQKTVFSYNPTTVLSLERFVSLISFLY